MTVEAVTAKICSRAAPVFPVEAGAGEDIPVGVRGRAPARLVGVAARVRTGTGSTTPARGRRFQTA